MLSQALNAHGIPAPEEDTCVIAATSSKHRATKTTLPACPPDTTSQQLLIPGVEGWLQALRLEAYLDGVMAWAQEMGAVELDEVVENRADLCHALPLKPLEAKRLEREGPRAASQLLSFPRSTLLPAPSGLISGVVESFRGAGEDGSWDAPAPSVDGEMHQAWVAPLTLEPTRRMLPKVFAPPWQGPGATSSVSGARPCEHGMASSGVVDDSRRITSHGKPTRRQPNKQLLQLPSSRAVGMGSQAGSSNEVGRARRESDEDPGGSGWGCEAPRDDPPALGGMAVPHGYTHTSTEAGPGYWEHEPSGIAQPPRHAPGASVGKNAGRCRLGRGKVGGRTGARSSVDCGTAVCDPVVAKAGAAMPSSAGKGKGKGCGTKAARATPTSPNDRAYPLGDDGGVRPADRSSAQTKPSVGRLRVDAAAGAGISLSWRPGKGYLVIDVESFPGQPGLQAGDTISAIEDARLDNVDTEEEVELRFGAAFADGAKLLITPGDTSERFRAAADHGQGNGGRAAASKEAAPAKDVGMPQGLPTTLQVQAGTGAGLSLVWHPPEGYLVEAIDSWPGQPGLSQGDILRAIDGVSLRVYNEARAESIMAAKLRDGVSIDVFRPQAHALNGDLVVLPTASGGATAMPVSPLWIPSVGVGTWSWGNDSWGFGSWGSSPGIDADEEVSAAFHAALDCGSFFFDTAPTYGKGYAETSLGSFVSAGRYAVIATKFFPRRRDRELAPALLSIAREAIKRLRLDGPLDLLQLHKPADPPVSLEAQADALASAVHAGLTRAVGICNFSLDELRSVHDRLRVAHGIPLSTCQVELSLLRQLPVTSGLLAACKEYGIVVLGFSPLAMGRLSGKYKPVIGTPWHPRWGCRGEQTRPFGASLDSDPGAMSKLLQVMLEMSRRYKCTVAQVALNWVLCQGAVAIPGARSRSQAEENAGAMGWRLSAQDVKTLSSLGADGSTSDFQHG